MELNGILRGDQINVLSTVYLVFLTPSVIGSFSVLVVSTVRWRHLRQQVHLLVQLALADLLAALILMSATVMNNVSTVYSVAICQYSLPLSLKTKLNNKHVLTKNHKESPHKDKEQMSELDRSLPTLTFYFISFLLVVVYAWKTKNALQGWRARPAEDEGGQSQCRRKIVAIPVYAMVWLIPIAIYLAYVFTPLKSTLLIPIADRSEIVHNDTKYCSSCILFLHVWKDSCSDTEKIHDTFIRVFLFMVVIPVFLSCSVIYYKVGKWYERHQHQFLFPVEGDGRSRRRFKQGISTARKMVMVILICWAPALVLILLSTLMIWTNIEQRSLFGLYMIQAASVSLQGFLNSMVYAWRRPNFTEAVLGENTPLVAHEHLAFFDESLRSSS